MSLKPPKPSQLVPGYRLDRYELVCPIARGGMAEVWVARLRGKHGFEKLLAIKTILPQFAEDPSFQHMFLDEARIASGIEHQNVAHILDLGEEHDVLYLVMEWVDGDALSKLTRAAEKNGTKLPIGVLLRVLADTCGGLQAAHDLRDKHGNTLHVVHRDVSPQNILVNVKGVAKLIDFGIVKARDRLAGDTSSGMLKGKLQYMAPEQALGKPIDHRADIWAIGAILQHLVTGTPPFQAENQLATLHLLASGKPPQPLPPGVPEPVVDVVRRCLQHDPDKRFATAGELQKAIEGAMAEAWVTTSIGEVASFVAEHLGDRAEDRRKTIRLALEAANERDKMLAQMRANSTDSPSTAGAKGLEPRGILVDVEPKPLGTVPPPAERSAATTLGSSYLEGATEPVSPTVERRRKMAMGVVAAAAALLVVGATIVLARNGLHARDAAASGSEGDKKEQSLATPTTAEPTPSQPAAPAKSAENVTPPEKTAASTSASASSTAAIKPALLGNKPGTKPKTPPKTVDDGF